MLLVSGALSGMSSSIACYPLDLARSYLTVQRDNRYKGLLHTLNVVYSTHGVTGLYRGLMPTMMGIAPYVAINFTVFDLLKRRFLPERSHDHFDAINLMLGATAGFSAASLTYPTDILRRRMQLQGFGGDLMPKYRNSFDCIVKTYNTEGVVGFYKGLVPCLVKVVPSMAIAFATYERLRRYFRFDPVSKGMSSGS